MGNIGGIQRRGGLDLEKVVFPALQRTVEDLFPTVLKAELRGAALNLEWVLPENRRFGEPAVAWYQQTAARVGGKHLWRAGDAGYWIMAVISHNTACRIPGRVRLYDEGVGGVAWEATPSRYPDLWTFLRIGSTRVSWERTVMICRSKVASFYETPIKGLSSQGFPDWAKEGLEAPLPPVEGWFPSYPEAP